MALILAIDTATESASVALSKGAGHYYTTFNLDQKDHAAWIHVAIQELLKEFSITMQQLDAVAVTSGPGSYTGLRVGMATAKGICYALKIPLITESTLKVMVAGAVEAYEADGWDAASAYLFCPMIDARRMEVFTAVYDANLNELLSPQAMILNEDSFNEELTRSTVVFLGSGHTKFSTIKNHPNAIFGNFQFHAGNLALLCQAKFEAGDFTDPAYAEPAYLKEFYTHTKK